MTYTTHITKTPTLLSIHTSGKTQPEDISDLIKDLVYPCQNYAGNKLLMDFCELDTLQHVIGVCNTISYAPSVKERRVKLAILTVEKETKHHAQHKAALSSFGNYAALFTDKEQALAWLKDELPALPPVAKDLDAALAFLQTYGVDCILTEQDDARLWAAARCNMNLRPK